MSNKLDRLRQLRDQLNINISGRENINKNDLCLFISNHTSLMDIFYLPIAVDVPMIDVISSRLVYKKILDRQKMVEDYLYAMPLEAHGGKKYSDLCMKSCAELLASGVNLGIFPEGAYLPGTTVYRGRTGATRILYTVKNMGIDVKLIPVSIDRKDKFDIDSYGLDDGMVDIRILKPINYENSYNKFLNSTEFTDKNDALHEPIDICMSTIADSLDRPYCNDYIELIPKGNIIFSNGSTVLTADAQDEKYISLYKKDLDDRVKTLKKEITYTKNKSELINLER